MSTAKKSDHVVLMSGGVFRCDHCGRTHDPHGGEGKPVDIGAMLALSKWFTEEHARCKKPKRALCSFCNSTDHGWMEHVNATVKTAEAWPNCGDTGLSSKTIWAHMMSRSQDATWGPRAPADPADLGRCLRLLDALWAAGWRERIGEMERYPGWAPLVEAWAEVEGLYREELAAGGDTAPRTYARMKALGL